MKHGVEPETSCSSSTISMLMKDGSNGPPNVSILASIYVIEQIIISGIPFFPFYFLCKKSPGYCFYPWRGMGDHFSEWGPNWLNPGFALKIVYLWRKQAICLKYCLDSVQYYGCLNPFYPSILQKENSSNVRYFLKMTVSKNVIRYLGYLVGKVILDLIGIPFLLYLIML